MSPRIDRDELFMEVAQLVSLRGTCPRKQVGAVIVRENRIISIGYNGAPQGMPHCTKMGCGGEIRGYYGEKTGNFPNGCTRAIHAEMNAIAFAARQGAPTDDATMYSTCATCANCAALLVSSGITKFIYRELYRDPAGINLLSDAEVEIIRWTP